MTHGEYSSGRDAYSRAAAMETLDVRRRGLLASGTITAQRLLAATKEGAQGQGERELLKQELGGTVRRALRQEVEPAADGADADAGAVENPPFYMVVGFEVSPCSIKRQPGAEVEDIICGVDNDEHIEPQVRELAAAPLPPLARCFPCSTTTVSQHWPLAAARPGLWGSCSLASAMV